MPRLPETPSGTASITPPDVARDLLLPLIEGEAPRTDAEIAESHRRASEHMAIIREALAGYEAAPRLKRGVKPRPLAYVGEDPVDEQRMVVDILWLMVVVCRRPACLRERRCCAAHRAEVHDHAPPLPCHAALPAPVKVLMPVALARRLRPELFRDPDKLDIEARAVRLARRKLDAMAAPS